MGESSFWYRPTRVVPDQRPLNGRCCCCCMLVFGAVEWNLTIHCWYHWYCWWICRCCCCCCCRTDQVVLLLLRPHYYSPYFHYQQNFWHHRHQYYSVQGSICAVYAEHISVFFVKSAWVKHVLRMVYLSGWHCMSVSSTFCLWWWKNTKSLSTFTASEIPTCKVQFKYKNCSSYLPRFRRA